MADFRSVRQGAYIPPAVLGINAAPCNAAIGPVTIDLSGMNTLVLLCKFVRVAGTGNIDLTVEAFDDAQNDWFFLQGQTVSSGTATMDKLVLRKATGSVSQNYEIRLKDLTFRKVRISMPSAVGAAGATDTLSITAITSYQAG